MYSKSDSIIWKVQSVQNAAAISSPERDDATILRCMLRQLHITDALSTARHRTRAVQDRSANVQSSARQRATISGTSCHRRRPTWSACFAVSKYQPLGHQTVYCWQPCLSGCCSSSLERSARGRHFIIITAVFPASIKDSSFSNIVSTFDSLTAYQASL